MAHPITISTNPVRPAPIDNPPTKYRNGVKSGSASFDSKSADPIDLSSSIARTIGGVRDTAKELETSKERLKTNAARNFMQVNIINFTSCRFFYEECAEKMSILFS